MTCKHETYAFHVNAINLSDTGGKTANITGKCDYCGQPLRFLGLPIGSSISQPTCNVDGTEIRVPFAVGDEPAATDGIGWMIRGVTPPQ